MAYIYAKSPNGTTQSINIDTMNITSSLQQNGWCKLPNGLIFQWQVHTETNYIGKTWITVNWPLQNLQTKTVQITCSNSDFMYFRTTWNTGYFQFQTDKPDNRIALNAFCIC